MYNARPWNEKVQKGDVKGRPNVRCQTSRLPKPPEPTMSLLSIFSKESYAFIESTPFLRQKYYIHYSAPGFFKPSNSSGRLFHLHI